MVAKHLLLGVAALSLAGAAQAGTVSDGTDDFQSQYRGVHAGNLDINKFSVAFDGANFTVKATVNGDLTDDLANTNTFFILGVDTGGNAVHFADITPGGVKFDQVFKVNRGPNGETTANGVTTKIDGDTLTLTIALASITANKGFDPWHYGFNLWSRDTSAVAAANGINGTFGDFAPNAGTIAAVPEPASWAMMLGGFGLVGGAMRRRRTSVRFA